PPMLAFAGSVTMMAKAVAAAASIALPPCSSRVTPAAVAYVEPLATIPVWLLLKCRGVSAKETAIAKKIVTVVKAFFIEHSPDVCRGRRHCIYRDRSAEVAG